MNYLTPDEIESLTYGTLVGMLNGFDSKASNLLDFEDYHLVRSLLESAIHEVFLKLSSGEYDSELNHSS